jgi:predicted dinucleotide-binding enzyme
MTIGIIGSGAIATAFARTLARAGIEATISNSRDPDSLNELVRQLGPSIKAGTREEAARADIRLRRGQLDEGSALCLPVMFCAVFKL